MKFKIILVTFCIVCLIIIIPSVISITNAHEENLYLVTEKRIIEAAILCVKEEKCSGNVIFLETLYDLDYLENEFDPVTKEYFDVLSYVRFGEEKTEFIIVN